MAKTKTPGTAVTTPLKTGVVDIAAEMKKLADNIKDKIGTPSGDLIRCTQDKKFAPPGGAETEGPLVGVILDFVSANHFFDRPYAKGQESAPGCFAVSDSPREMVPETAALPPTFPGRPE